MELTLPDGEHFSVQLTRDQLEELELVEGRSSSFARAPPDVRGGWHPQRCGKEAEIA